MNIAQISIVNSIQLLYDGEILPILLLDRTTKKNIVWATEEYKTEERRLNSSSSIDLRDITGDYSNRIRPRFSKSLESQKNRTKKKAEVFTPSWICNRMNNDIDEDYLGYKDAFNTSNDKTWIASSAFINFEGIRSWKEYVDLTRLEITCGEAPFVTSRYFPSTGEMIDVKNRVGFLDRKLRVVSENSSGDEYLEWSLRALQSSYGYEYQGDNLLIARINVFLTWFEHCLVKNCVAPSLKDAKEAAKIISWNFWQMDGLTGAVPTKPLNESDQISIFELLGSESILIKEETYCRFFNWRANKSQTYNNLKGDKNMKKFFAVIGNPPYQGDNHMQLYPDFYISGRQIADCVELIFPTGWQDPKNANNLKKMNTKEVKEDHQIVFIDNVQNAFPNMPSVEWTNIIMWKNGYDNGFDGLQKITENGENPQLVKLLCNKSEIPIPADMEKALSSVIKREDFISFSSIVISRTAYRMTPLVHQEHPEALSQLSKGHPYDMSTNIFDRLPQIFYSSMPTDNYEYRKIFGRQNNKRVYMYMRKDYVNTTVNTDFYKVILPSAWDEVMPPTIEKPQVGTTESFITIGVFKTLKEAQNCQKYIMTKFARGFLTLNKHTHHVTPESWKYVPLQDFTSKSDIDWSKSIHELDLQLYDKYRLSQKARAYIENIVKEMT